MPRSGLSDARREVIRASWVKRFGAAPETVTLAQLGPVVMERMRPPSDGAYDPRLHTPTATLRKVLEQAEALAREVNAKRLEHRRALDRLRVALKRALAKAAALGELAGFADAHHVGDRLDGIEGAGWSAVGRVEWILGAALDAVGNPSPHPSLVPRSFLELAGFRLGEPARKGAAAEAVLRALGFSQKDTADACGYLGHRKLADDPELAAVEIAKRGRDAVAKRERRRRTKRR